MRLKRRDKQQQKYQHGMDTSMVQTFTYSQASTSHHYPVFRTQMQAQHQHRCSKHQSSNCHSSNRHSSRSAIADNFYRPFSGPLNLPKPIISAMLLFCQKQTKKKLNTNPPPPPPTPTPQKKKKKKKKEKKRKKKTTINK